MKTPGTLNENVDTFSIRIRNYKLERKSYFTSRTLRYIPSMYYRIWRNLRGLADKLISGTFLRQTDAIFYNVLSAKGALKKFKKGVLI